MRAHRKEEEEEEEEEEDAARKRDIEGIRSVLWNADSMTSVRAHAAASRYWHYYSALIR